MVIVREKMIKISERDKLCKDAFSDHSVIIMSLYDTFQFPATHFSPRYDIL